LNFFYNIKRKSLRHTESYYTNGRTAKTLSKQSWYYNVKKERLTKDMPEIAYAIEASQVLQQFD